MIRFENIFAYLYDTQRRLKKAKKEVDLKRATLEFALYGINVGVVASVGLVVLMQDWNTGLSMWSALGNAAHAMWQLGPGVLVVIPLLGALTSLVAFYFGCAVIGLFSLALGGKGSFNQNAYLVSRLVFPVSLVTIAIGFLSHVPIIGTVLPIIWSGYLFWIGVNVIHIANDIPYDKSALVLAVVVGIMGLAIKVV